MEFTLIASAITVGIFVTSSTFKLSSLALSLAMSIFSDIGLTFSSTLASTFGLFSSLVITSWTGAILTSLSLRVSSFVDCIGISSLTISTFSLMTLGINSSISKGFAL
jgi:hypothetical protein